MRLLANENVGRVIVDQLKGDGHDVAWIAADSPGAPDSDVIRRATAEDRIILTFDQDFGRLAFHSGIPPSTGVILLRLKAGDSPTLANLVIGALASRDDWSGHFSVVENERVRMTPLPSAQEQPS